MAISLNGTEHDGYVENVVVWNGKVGLLSRNGANQLSGVHVWNLAASLGGQGIVLA